MPVKIKSRAGGPIQDLEWGGGKLLVPERGEFSPREKIKHPLDAKNWEKKLRRAGKKG